MDSLYKTLCKRDVTLDFMNSGQWVKFLLTMEGILMVILDFQIVQGYPLDISLSLSLASNIEILNMSITEGTPVSVNAGYSCLAAWLVTYARG